MRAVEPPGADDETATQGGVLPDLADELRAAQAEAAAYLDALRARADLTGLPAEMRVQVVDRAGAVAAALLDYERDADVDLVVLSSHGRSGLARVALGSVAARLLRYGSADLLLVRAFGELPSLERVVVPLDGSTPAEWALRVADELAGSVVREVTLLRVIAAPEERGGAEEYLAGVAARRQKPGITYRWRVEQGEPTKAIVEAAGTATPVLLTTRGRSGRSRWPLGTVADRVAHSGEASVWLVRAEWQPNNH